MERVLIQKGPLIYEDGVLTIFGMKAMVKGENWVVPLFDDDMVDLNLGFSATPSKIIEELLDNLFLSDNLENLVRLECSPIVASALFLEEYLDAIDAVNSVYNSDTICFPSVDFQTTTWKKTVNIVVSEKAEENIVLLNGHGDKL